MTSPPDEQQVAVGETAPAGSLTYRVIPDGLWQRVLGFLLLAFGLFAALAATPFNGAGGVATACLGLAGPLLFWGLMLKYLSLLERKIDLIIRRGPRAQPGEPVP